MKILIFGGTGFLGRAVCAQLKEHSVKTFGKDGNYKGSILHEEEIYEAVQDKDVVINLVGLTPLREPKYTSYRLVHVQGIKAIIAACERAKVKRLVHVSALGADVHGITEYLRTKGEAEELLLNMKNCTILRPSIILDHENELVTIIKKWPFFPKINAHIQPVIRADMAQVIELAALGKIKEHVVDVAGPNTMTLYELAAKIKASQQKMIIPIPFFIVWVGIWVLAKLHLFGFGDDQLKNLSLDNTTENRIIDKYITLRSVDSWVKE